MSTCGNTPEHCPWICHVCDTTGTGESTACSVCYKTVCTAHLKWIPAYNRETGLYEIAPVCLHCAASGVIG